MVGPRQNIRQEIQTTCKTELELKSRRLFHFISGVLVSLLTLGTVCLGKAVMYALGKT